MVLEKEIQSLLKLKSSLYNPFIRSCKLIKKTSGKTIFIGLGKSDHISEKLDSFVFSFINENTIS